MNTQKIYIQLLEEGSDAARPTQAEVLENGTYKVLPTPNYDPEDEVWEFLPDSIVRCEKRLYNGKEFLLAVERVNS